MRTLLSITLQQKCSLISRLAGIDVNQLRITRVLGGDFGAATTFLWSDSTPRAQEFLLLPLRAAITVAFAVRGTPLPRTRMAMLTSMANAPVLVALAIVGGHVCTLLLLLLECKLHLLLRIRLVLLSCRYCVL